MLARKLKYHGYRIAPGAAAALHGMLRRWTQRRATRVPDQREHDPRSVSRALLEQARALQDRSRDVHEPECALDLVLQYGGIATNQNRGEILGLLEMIRELRPRCLCEIGSAAGGTLFLLSRVAHAEARILSIDVNNDAERRERFELLVRSTQDLTCLEGDSHDQETLRRFRSWIGDGGLDFLFIDGDHSLEGVTRDHEVYGPYVRPGGIIAFHDIVPDFKTRYGTDTGTYAGGVPKFWARGRDTHAGVSEFIDHPLQDGRGIGAIRVPDDRPPRRG